MLTCSLLAAATVFLGLTISKLFFPANNLLERLALALPPALLAVLAGAYLLGPVGGRWPTIISSVLAAALLSFYAKKYVSDAKNPSSSIRLKIAYTLCFILIFIGACYLQTFYTSASGWLSNPLIASFTLNIYPAQNPLFPGQPYPWPYGAELILGALLPHGYSPFRQGAIFTPILIALTFINIFGLLKAKETPPCCSIIASLAPLILAFIAVTATLALKLDASGAIGCNLAIFILYSATQLYQPKPAAGAFRQICFALGLGVALGLYYIISPAVFLILFLSVLSLAILLLAHTKQKIGSLIGLSLTLTLAAAAVSTLAGSINIVPGLVPNIVSQPPPNPPKIVRSEQIEPDLSEADLICLQALSQQILPAEKLLTVLELKDDTTKSLLADSAASTLSGAQISGWSRRLSDGRNDNYSIGQVKRSNLFIALKSSNRPDLLWNSGVDWLLLNADKVKLSQALMASPYALLIKRAENKDGTKRELWQLSPAPSLKASSLYSQPPFRTFSLLAKSKSKFSLANSQPLFLNPAQPYRLEISAFNASERYSRLGWLKIQIKDLQGKAGGEPLYYLLGQAPLPPQTGDLQEVSLVTPPGPGAYIVTGDLITGPSSSEPLFSFPIAVQDKP